MKAKQAQRITEGLGQFKLSSVTIEKEFADWDAEGSERNLLILRLLGDVYLWLPSPIRQTPLPATE